MTNTTETPRTDACPHCGYAWRKSWGMWYCGTFEQTKGILRTELCYEREARQKAEAEVERLNQHIKTQNLIAREEAKILQRWKEWGMTHEEKGKQLEANLRRAVEIADQSVMFHPSISRYKLRDELDQIKATLNPTDK